MLHIILFEPEIPQNTGALIRLSANMGAKLHLVEPFQFDLSEKSVRRAGLDYKEMAQVFQYPNLETCLKSIQYKRLFALTTKATQAHSTPSYQAGDAFLFGPESRGLPTEILQSLPQEQLIRIPMQADSRSLNLANAVSIMAYEAWRQMDYVPLN